MDRSQAGRTWKVRTGGTGCSALRAAWQSCAHILAALPCHLCCLSHLPGALHPLAASPDFQVDGARGGEGWPGEQRGEGEGEDRNLRRETERGGGLTSRARAGDSGRTRTETASQRQSWPEEDGRGEMEATSCGVKITKPPRERRLQTERGGRGSNGQRVGNQAESRPRGRARRGKEDRRQRSGGR